MKGKLTLLAVLLLPWLSIVKVDKFVFKRYLPVLTFSSLVIAFISELSKSFTWWKVRKPLFLNFQATFLLYLDRFYS